MVSGYPIRHTDVSIFGTFVFQVAVFTRCYEKYTLTLIGSITHIMAMKIRIYEIAST